MLKAKKIALTIALFFGILVSSCSWGRYPCPPAAEKKNTEKDGTGVDIVQVKKTKHGLIKKKNPKRIKK